MACAHCEGAGRLFGPRMVAQEWRRYRKRGPRPTTAVLVEGLAAEGASGRTLLDIGGGIGAVQLALFERGLVHATSVDASPEFVAAARAAAQQAGLGGRVEYRTGDFVDLVDELPRCDLVSLDRVVCCYPDAGRLIAAAAHRTRWRLGMVWPLDRWWTRAGAALANLLLRLRRNPFRVFVHSDAAVDGTVRAQGLERVCYARRGLWQVAVYARELPRPATGAGETTVDRGLDVRGAGHA